MTTPNDLYAMEPESFGDFHDLKGYYYSHIPESDVDLDMLWGVEAPRIQVKHIKDFCFDGRRTWTLSTVWFDDKPVMVTQNAGREGDDHAERFVTDSALLVVMIEYLESLVVLDAIESDCHEYNPSSDIDGLTSFYGDSLDGEFERY